MERIKTELAELTNQLGKPLNDDRGYANCESIEEKARHILYSSTLRDGSELTKLSLLSCITSGDYWHAWDSLGKMWPRLGEEDRDFYLKATLYQAYSGPSSFGNVWILGKYDNAELSGSGMLKDRLSEGELKDVVNRAVWEFLNGLYTSPGFSIPRDDYALLNKYFGYVDFSKTKELRSDKPLIALLSGWPDDAYKSAFESARGNIDWESEVWLAHPIIDQIFRNVVYREDCGFECNLGRSTMIKRAQISLEKYGNYMNDPLVQSMLKEWLGESVVFVNAYDDTADDAVPCIDFLLKYIDSSEEDKKQLVCQFLPKEKDLYTYLIHSRFPKRLLTNDTLHEVQDQLLAWLNTEHLGKKDLLEFIGLTKNAASMDFLNQETAQTLLKSALDAYAKFKPRPATDLVLEMHRNLDDLLKLGLIEQQDYFEKGLICVSDLRLRKKNELAYDLERKLNTIKYGKGEGLEAVKTQIRAEHASAEKLQASAKTRERRGRRSHHRQVQAMRRRSPSHKSGKWP